MDGITVAAEVVTAGTALAGLILIYIGSLASGYGAYSAVEQKAVRARFLARAWLAFIGFFLALVAAAFAIIGKWVGDIRVANVAVWLLLLAFAWTVFATVQAIQEMK